ncbi:hypothetical protein GQ55_8G006600 [Panicum hallii var. hallii]|uniref:Uncharacterized protein n=1 Tax=Panicum hallii var. hallii TaxID=1504633 RepID=A0A2T7CJ82_9POAL|nr:hypothetical protein GQ55_8G006600 [Panicum hallii var. hallii]
MCWMDHGWMSMTHHALPWHWHFGSWHHQAKQTRIDRAFPGRARYGSAHHQRQPMFQTQNEERNTKQGRPNGQSLGMCNKKTAFARCPTVTVNGPELIIRVPIFLEASGTISSPVRSVIDKYLTFF